MQNFLKFSFFPFYGCPKFENLSKIAKNTKILTLIWPRKIYLRNWKIPKYPINHLKVYLHEQIWLNPNCTCSKFDQSTWKFDTFSTQWNFPYISYDLHKYCDKIKQFRQLINKWFHSGKEKGWGKHM